MGAALCKCCPVSTAPAVGGKKVVPAAPMSQHSTSVESEAEVVTFTDSLLDVKEAGKDLVLVKPARFDPSSSHVRELAGLALRFKAISFAVRTVGVDAPKSCTRVLEAGEQLPALMWLQSDGKYSRVCKPEVRAMLAWTEQQVKHPRLYLPSRREETRTLGLGILKTALPAMHALLATTDKHVWPELYAPIIDTLTALNGFVSGATHTGPGVFGVKLSAVDLIFASIISRLKACINLRGLTLPDELEPTKQYLNRLTQVVEPSLNRQLLSVDRFVAQNTLYALDLGSNAHSIGTLALNTMCDLLLKTLRQPVCEASLPRLTRIVTAVLWCMDRLTCPTGVLSALGAAGAASIAKIEHLQGLLVHDSGLLTSNSSDGTRTTQLDVPEEWNCGVMDATAAVSRLLTTHLREQVVANLSHDVVTLCDRRTFFTPDERSGEYQPCHTLRTLLPVVLSSVNTCQAVQFLALIGDVNGVSVGPALLQPVEEVVDAALAAGDLRPDAMTAIVHRLTTMGWAAEEPGELGKPSQHSVEASSVVLQAMPSVAAFVL